MAMRNFVSGIAVHCMRPFCDNNDIIALVRADSQLYEHFAAKPYVLHREHKVDDELCQLLLKCNQTVRLRLSAVLINVCGLAGLCALSTLLTTRYVSIESLSFYECWIRDNGVIKLLSSHCLPSLRALDLSNLLY